MLVKCRKCGNKIDRNDAFKVVVDNKNVYYCNEKEYEEHVKEKQKIERERFIKKKEQQLLKQKKEKEKIIRERIYDSITRIFGYLPKNTALYKEMNELIVCFGYELIDDYLKEREDYLYDTIQNKNFESEYGKIRYFSAILKNTLVDFENKRQEKKEESAKVYDINVVKMKFKRKQKRKSLEEIENNIEDGEKL